MGPLHQLPVMKGLSYWASAVPRAHNWPPLLDSETLHVSIGVLTL